jgi:hypothetical protein
VITCKECGEEYERLECKKCGEPWPTWTRERPTEPGYYAWIERGIKGWGWTDMHPEAEWAPGTQWLRLPEPPEVTEGEMR